jgi:pyruvate/2-oxoglutarate/acetoin dehydrogenase E1 component
MMNATGELADDRARIELGQAVVVQEGSDVTVVGTQLMRLRAEKAATILAGERISVELIDPRTLAPLDLETIGSSIDKTGRLLALQEAPFAGSWGATVMAALVRDRFESLDAPPAIVCGAATPVPYSGVMEDSWLTVPEGIVDAVRALSVT